MMIKQRPFRLPSLLPLAVVEISKFRCYAAAFVPGIAGRRGNESLPVNEESLAVGLIGGNEL